MKKAKWLPAVLIIGFVLMPIFSEDDSWTKKITPKIALKAINIIEQDPLSKDFEGAVSVILNFAEYSNDVLVKIGDNIAPWIGRKIPLKKKSMLLGAFVAGNIKIQIVTGIPKDHPYEGLVFMIKVYNAWRKANLIEKIPELDLWSTYTKEELNKYLEANL